MDRSLTALLPVRNAQSTLSEAVLDLLEILPELTSPFEIVIVDDGSVDATIEVADELAAYYPQVAAHRHSTPQGRLASITTGLQHSTGEIVLLQDADCTVPSDEIYRLWSAISVYEVVLGRPSHPLEWQWHRANALESENRGGFLMFHRQASSRIEAYLAQSHRLRQYLATHHVPWHEVALRDRFLQPNRQRQRAGGGQLRGLAGLWSTAAGLDAPQPISSKPKRPNYLQRLRAFASGE